MTTEVRSSDFKVLASGSFLLFDTESDARVKLDFRPEFLLTVEVIYKFVEDEELPDSAIEAEADKGVLIITCRNVNNPFGNGMVKPALLAMVGNKKIYHNFFVSRPGKESPRMFYYTYYTEV